MKTLEDYHDLYLLTDVLLLADEFEMFRKTLLAGHGTFIYSAWICVARCAQDDGCEP